MRDLQAQLSRVGGELAATQQQAHELQESNSHNQEELRVARLSSDHLSNDLARALEQANTWREECVALQVRRDFQNQADSPHKSPGPGPLTLNRLTFG